MKKLSISIFVIFAGFILILFLIHSPQQAFEWEEDNKFLQPEETEQKIRNHEKDSIQEETEDDIPTKLIFYVNDDSLVIDTSKIRINQPYVFFKKSKVKGLKIYFLDSSFVYRERPYEIRIHYASGYYAEAKMHTTRMSTFPKTRYIFYVPEVDTIPFEIRDSLMLLPSLGYSHKNIPLEK